MKTAGKLPLAGYPAGGNNAQAGRSRLGRLKKRADFLRVAKGPRWAMPGLVLQAAPQPGEEGNANAPRLGFTVTKKVGIAVVRNRARRRLKAAAAEVMPRLARPGMDYVLVGRGDTLTREFADLIRDLETALNRIGDKR